MDVQLTLTVYCHLMNEKEIKNPQSQKSDVYAHKREPTGSIIGPSFMRLQYKDGYTVTYQLLWVATDEQCSRLN